MDGLCLIQSHTTASTDLSTMPPFNSMIFSTGSNSSKLTASAPILAAASSRSLTRSTRLQIRSSQLVAFTGSLYQSQMRTWSHLQHTTSTAQDGGISGHQAHRPSAEHGNAFTGLEPREGDAVPTRWKDVGEEDEVRLVLASRRQFQGVEVSIGDPKVLAIQLC